MTQQYLQAPGYDDHGGSGCADFQEGGYCLSYAQVANENTQQHQQEHGVEQVLYRVGKNQGGHTNGAPEGQGDGEITTVADEANYHGYDGIFSGIKCRQ